MPRKGSKITCVYMYALQVGMNQYFLPFFPFIHIDEYVCNVGPIMSYSSFASGATCVFQIGWLHFPFCILDISIDEVVWISKIDNYTIYTHMYS